MRISFVLLLISYFTVQSVIAQKLSKQPNIIFIMADDLGWQDVGFMGSKWFETPHLDKLAEQSMVFTNAYMYPTCSPSRTALLTGRQSFRTGVYTVPVLEGRDPQKNIHSRWTIGHEHPVYAEPLREAGYKLIHIGKWHIVGPNPEQEDNYPLKKKLGQPKGGDISWIEEHKTIYQKYYPIGRGFHKNVGGTWWGDPARGYVDGYHTQSGGYKAPFKNPFIEDKDDDEWLTDRLADEAISFIDRNKESAFFVNLHFYAPHRPTVPRNEEWLNKFKEKAPDLVTGQHSEKLNEIAGYATMVKSVDENVKRIIDYLDEQGLRENTIIFFTSDNGFNGLQSCNNRLRGCKGYIYEGGIRVPALVNWKGKVTPGKSDNPICGMDYFPTFLDLADINNYQEILDGKSLLPSLTGAVIEERPLFWHIASSHKNPPCSAIRKGHWKLIQFLLNGKVELYNLKDDLRESNDLSEKETAVKDALLMEMVNWRKSNKVPLPPASILKY